MKNKERGDINFARLHNDVIKGKSGKKIIWQPRIQCWIDDKKYAGEDLPEPYNGLTKPEIYRKLGCSARIYEYNDCFQRKDDDRVKKYSEKISETETKYVMETPVGKISKIVENMESTWAVKTNKWWVSSREDLKVAIWIEERAEYEWNEQHYQKTFREWGNLGAPTVFLPRVNIQHLYIDMMGVEEATYALIDYPDIIEKYFAVLDDSHERLIKVVNESPVEIINFGDNIHAGTLPPYLFEKYVLPAYQKRNELLHAAGKFTHAHWDGDVKPLLPYVQDTGLNGIEAITPEPQGDISLKEVKKAFGDDIFLIDGIAAILFDHTFSVDELIQQTKEVIDLFAPNLILGISDEISSTGDIERIKVVGEIVDEYNSKL